MKDLNLHQNHFSDRNLFEQQPIYQWLTANEAANYLRLTVPALRNMVYRGELKSYRLGRRSRFLRNDLLQLLIGNQDEELL